ncbi:MAG: CidA/LrgA family protein [Burkholderiales bacterium PBB5]|nr:MAG: CidA/LrgA family protein [Burkholderiales bacterium PBB5]
MTTFLHGLALLLLCQSAGEAVARGLLQGLGLPLPGPVLGMLALVAVLAWQQRRPAVAQAVGSAADGLLAHLSLLFVPVGVGVMTHFALIARHGPRMAVALVLSTLLGLAVTAWVLRALLPPPAPAAAA